MVGKGVGKRVRSRPSTSVGRRGKGSEKESGPGYLPVLEEGRFRGHPRAESIGVGDGNELLSGRS
jgi:hypothetical protein